jgi:hypothetical protein
MEHLRKLRQFFRDKDHTFPIPHVNEAMLQHLEDTYTHCRGGTLSRYQVRFALGW